jgi:hypothetical protein
MPSYDDDLMTNEDMAVAIPVHRVSGQTTTGWLE